VKLNIKGVMEFVNSKYRNGIDDVIVSVESFFNFINFIKRFGKIKNKNIFDYMSLIKYTFPIIVYLTDAICKIKSNKRPESPLTKKKEFY
jgi:hypothetical protein